MTLAAEAGLGKRLKLEKWGPVRCVLSNDSGRDVRGVVTVELPARGSGKLMYTAPVVLPYASKRAVTLYIRPNNYLDEIPVRFTVSDAAGTLQQAPRVVTLVDSSSVALLVTKRDIGLRRATAFGSMTHIDVANAKLGELPDRALGYGPIDLLVTDGVSFRELTPEQERALRRWVLDGGKLVVAGGRHSDLIPGTILDDLLPVTIGRQRTRTLNKERTAERPRDKGTIKITVPATAKPIVTAACRPRPGADVLLKDAQDSPLVVTHEVGAGGVMFLAFDLSSAPILTSERLPALYRGIMQWAGLVPPDYDASFPDWMIPRQPPPAPLSASVQAAVYQTAATTVPPLSSLAIFLGAYVLVVGPLDYFLLKKLRRRHWTILTFPLIVAGFTYAAYYAASEFKGRQVFVNEINILRQRGDSAHVSSYFGVYSPETASYDLHLRDASAAIFPLAPVAGEGSPTPSGPAYMPSCGQAAVIRRGGGTVTYPRGALPQAYASTAQMNYQIMMAQQRSGYGVFGAAEPYGRPYVTQYDSEGTALPETPIDMWAMRTFFADWWLDGRSVTAQLALEGDRIKGAVKNGTRFDLSDCLLVFEGILIPIGDIPNGKASNLNVAVSRRALRELVGGEREDIIKGADEEERVARAVALGSLGVAAGGQQYRMMEWQRGGWSSRWNSGLALSALQPMLIGWTREPLLPVEVAGHDPGRRAVSMWVADVKIEGWKPKEQAMAYY